MFDTTIWYVGPFSGPVFGIQLSDVRTGQAHHMVMAGGGPLGDGVGELNVQIS